MLRPAGAVDEAPHLRWQFLVAGAVNRRQALGDGLGFVRHRHTGATLAVVEAEEARNWDSLL